MPSNRFQLFWIAGAAVVVLVLSCTVYRLTRMEKQPANVPPVSLSTSRDGTPKADDILTKLVPGMLRVDVESLLGPPSNVDSVQSANGKMVYRATFTRDRLRPPLPPLVLEFDASQTGHPLIIARTQ